jgi:hypothetical protein
VCARYFPRGLTDFLSNHTVSLGAQAFGIGDFSVALITFIIVAFVIFIIVKVHHIKTKKWRIARASCLSSSKSFKDFRHSSKGQSWCWKVCNGALQLSSVPHLSVGLDCSCCAFSSCRYNLHSSAGAISSSKDTVNVCCLSSINFYTSSFVE